MPIYLLRCVYLLYGTGRRHQPYTCALLDVALFTPLHFSIQAALLVILLPDVVNFPRTHCILPAAPYLPARLPLRFLGHLYSAEDDFLTRLDVTLPGRKKNLPAVLLRWNGLVSSGALRGTTHFTPPFRRRRTHAAVFLPPFSVDKEKGAGHWLNDIASLPGHSATTAPHLWSPGRAAWRRHLIPRCDVDVTLLPHQSDLLVTPVFSVRRTCRLPFRSVCFRTACGLCAHYLRFPAPHLWWLAFCAARAALRLPLNRFLRYNNDTGATPRAFSCLRYSPL